MDIELIDKAWACLPKEFKEEVKEIFRKCLGVPKYEAITIKPMLLGYLFGHHNLTSDEEGEEILYVKASQVKELYQYAEEREKGRAPRESEEEWYQGYMKAMQDLFGSKCLPDEKVSNPTPLADLEPCTGPKFKIGDKVRVKFNAKELHSNPDPSKNIYYWQTTRDKYLGKVFKITDIWKSGTITLNTAEVMFWEPFDLEPYTELEENQNPSDSTELKPQDVDKHFDNILKDGFHDHDRLHIAAMAMQGILSNADRMKGYEHIATAPPCEELTVVVARNALRYADELIRQSGKGDSKRTTTSHSARVENALGKANAAATAPTKTRTKDYTFQCADLQTQTNAPSFGGRKEKKNE